MFALPQEGPNPRNRAWAGVATVAKVEYETGIADNFAAEPGRGQIILT